jgi:hypothetical protein
MKQNILSYFIIASFIFCNVACKKKNTQLKAEDYGVVRTNIRAHIEAYAISEMLALQIDYAKNMKMNLVSDNNDLTFDSIYVNDVIAYNDNKYRKGFLSFKFLGKLTDTNNVFLATFNYKRDSILVTGSFTITEKEATQRTTSIAVRNKQIEGSISFTYLNKTKGLATLSLLQSPKSSTSIHYSGTLFCKDEAGNEANVTTLTASQNVSIPPPNPGYNPTRIGFGESKIYTTQQGNGRLIFGYVSEVTATGYYDDFAYLEFKDKGDLQLNVDMRNL